MLQNGEYDVKCRYGECLMKSRDLALLLPKSDYSSKGINYCIQFVLIRYHELDLLSLLILYWVWDLVDYTNDRY